MWNFTLHVRLRPKTCSIVQRWCFIRFIAVGLSAVLDSRLVTRYIDNHTGNTYDRSEWAPYGNLRMLLCNYKADQNVAVSNSCHTQVVVEKCVWQSDMKLWVWKRKQTKRVRGSENAVLSQVSFVCPEIFTNTKQADHNDSECAYEISLCMSGQTSVVKRKCSTVALSAVLDSCFVTCYGDNHTDITCHDRSQWAPKYGNLGRMLLCKYKTDQNVPFSNSCHFKRFYRSVFDMKGVHKVETQ